MSTFITDKARNFLDYFQPPGESPIGLLKIRATDEGLTEIDYVEIRDETSRPNALTQRCQAQLAEYFEGKRREFDLPLTPRGTEFQQQVWMALREIPYGKTCSYSSLAESLNRPGAQRAVGAANGKNPLSIVVPCHRVIGRSGRLTGYAGGLDRKEWLLMHERKH